MRLIELERFRIPRPVLEKWRERQGELLLPVQVRAIMKGLLEGERGGNLVIAAPTSSGKSFCAELAALQTLLRRKKTIIALPLRSLAEEQFERLRSTYRSLGIRSIVLSSDHPEADQQLLSGEYDLAIAIFEKLDRLLTQRLDLLATVGLIVIDELQMVSEPGRGSLLERLLTKVRASCYTPRLIGLSAALTESAAAELAGWLNAELVHERYRPVDLYRGVATGGKLQLRSANTGEDIEEPFPAAGQGDDLTEPVIDQLRQSRSGTLVFVKSRLDTVRLALQLASQVSWPAAHATIAGLQQEEPSGLLRTLMQTLGRGVAFHNADLATEQRRLVEQAFQAGQVRVLFSTTTLAMGVNLPASTVYLETVKYTTSRYGGRPVLVPVSMTEFENMAGRAGRLGHTDAPAGRAIVLAHSEFDRDVLWQTYINPIETIRPRSAMQSIPTTDWLLDLIVAGLVVSRSALQAVLGHTLATHQQALPSEHDIDISLRELAALGLITMSGGHHPSLQPTALGRAVATTGLSVMAADRLIDRLQEQFPDHPVSALALVLSTPDWVSPPGMVSQRELREQTWLRQLYLRFEGDIEAVRVLVPPGEQTSPLTYRQAAAIKGVLLLLDWQQLVPVQRLEERYQLHLGQISALADAAAHLLGGLGALSRAIAPERGEATLIGELIASLRSGMPPAYAELSAASGRLLGRADCARLQRAGISSREALLAADPDQLARLIPDHTRRLRIITTMQYPKEESPMQSLASVHLTGSPVTGRDSASLPQSLEIDGSCDADRFLVRIDGIPVRLTGKSFKYLTRLACARSRPDGGWIYKDDIEAGFNQARYLYRMKHEIAETLRGSWPIVENNRLGYYRLNLDPERISLNRANLAAHPDWEVRSLFQSEPISAGLN